MSNKNKHRFHKREYLRILRSKKTEDRLIALTGSRSESPALKEVIVYQSELDYLSRCILDYPNIETGGQLFGFYTSKGTPVVCYTIGPGKHANHQTTFFNQDLDYLQTVGDVLTREYGLQHIGEWHSHHRLGLDHPSGHDARTMHHSLDSLCLNQFLLCIATTNGISACVNAYSFLQNDPAYYPLRWNIKAEPSPYRDVVNIRLRDLLLHPATSEPRLKGMHISKITLPQDADAQYLLRAYNSNL
ncbi:MAG: Mov34/MPN/PAD-1 family protein [Paludibacteraceae bacterium]|nr:Mov34/MPN/PAD-1 family protein [Paludibacteraceae bacterium]